MKKILICLLSVAMLLCSLFGILGCSKQETPPSQEQEITPVSVTKSAVRINTDTYYSYSIYGTATNNIDDYISKVVITITVYDDVDVPMKKITITINGLESKQTKEYSQIYKVYKSQGRIPTKSEVTEVTYN